MKKIIALTFILPLVLLTACGIKKTTVKTTEKNDDKILKEMLSSNDPIYWLKTGDVGNPLRSEIKLPKSYLAYEIDQERLEDYFMKLKDRKTNQINIPLNGAMQYYALQEANTMNEELAAKYPEIQSLRGTNNANKNEQIFLDIDGKKLRVKITNNNGSYVVEPYETEKGLFYLVYDIKDTGYPKSKFE